MRISKFSRTAVASAVCSGALLSVSISAQANKDLERLSKENTNWVMQTKDYNASHFSDMTQINTHNVQHLQPVWSFSTGVLNGHEGGPLVVDGIMYVHTPFPNNIFAGMFGFKEKGYFAADPGADKAPTVDFKSK